MNEFHPCYNYEFRNYHRLHLPIAPKCNLSCKYCDRKYNCVNENRPGVTSKVIDPIEAYDKTLEYYRFNRHLFSTIGIADPGDCLANFDKLYIFLDLVQKNENLSKLNICIATNGLYLSKYATELLKLGVSHITVTINSCCVDTYKKIYDYIIWDDKKITDVENAHRILFSA